VHKFILAYLKDQDLLAQNFGQQDLIDAIYQEQFAFEN